MEPASTSVSEDKEGGEGRRCFRTRATAPSARSSGYTCTAYIHSFGFVWRGRGAAGLLRQMWDGLLPRIPCWVTGGQAIPVLHAEFSWPKPHRVVPLYSVSGKILRVP